MGQMTCWLSLNAELERPLSAVPSPCAVAFPTADVTQLEKTGMIQKSLLLLFPPSPQYSAYIWGCLASLVHLAPFL